MERAKDAAVLPTGGAQMRPVHEQAQRWPPYRGETYYGTGAVKPSPFDWRIAAYLFVSSLAGAAQLIADIADRVAPARMRPMTHNARAIAFAGSVISPVLLIGDLKTPQRWYNMLRIFRPTSPMSIGSYLLIAFGASSGLALLFDRLRRGSTRRSVPAATALPAALSGAGMLTYTGALLSTTSTPLWMAESRLLSARFAASGVAAGAAMLSAIEHAQGRHSNSIPLDRLGVVATAAYAVLSRETRERSDNGGVDAICEDLPHATLHKMSGTLLIALPLACHGLNLLIGSRSRVLSLVASFGTIAGAALMRYALLERGKASARRPADYLRYTACVPDDHEGCERRNGSNVERLA